MKPVRTLVVLIDDEKMKLLENHGVGKGLQPLEEAEFSRKEAEALEYSDQPGRSFESVGAMRHAMSPEKSVEEQQRDRWLREAMAHLSKRWQKGNFDRLVIAAPPKVLGLVRELLDRPLKEALYAEVAKDLVNVPERELPERFADVAAF
ncbi:Protein required for attachment to host cells [Meinhardsimonia xiamenensis]|jgi:protein required for attachment to host cells|uniref:Protein required for attachment to host cells n=1 Tax=Meinhardsimonia xiamenensis TaxID=990712 RepID=A0A1G9B5J0_9RHOB|nr:host attachment family protein [Meinhardsimonia xiamenensis]PRX35126.1 protein required for attachment to host cells [Meinhardsimonia xiamenensis]SDK34360.1 Protein required for attachment to host cells [Meinhardsimonia xiamenensis]